MRNKCNGVFSDLECVRRSRLIGRLVPGPVAEFRRPYPLFTTETDMQDLIWILMVLGLFAATLAYFRLCDKA